MGWVALKMLTGDRAKYLGLVFGVAFASMLMSHQVSIFCGLMLRTASQILDVRDAGIWICDPELQSVDEIEPLSDTDLFRVRSVTVPAMDDTAPPSSWGSMTTASPAPRSGCCSGRGTTCGGRMA
jgi:hypothetical protein